MGLGVGLGALAQTAAASRAGLGPLLLGLAPGVAGGAVGLRLGARLDLGAVRSAASTIVRTWSAAAPAIELAAAGAGLAFSCS